MREDGALDGITMSTPEKHLERKMATMRTSPLRVAAALFSAAVLTFAGAATAVAAPAAQAPTGFSAGPILNDANPALINPATKGTLHITKYAGAPIGTTYDNGLPTTVTGRTPLAGVKYEIYKVPGVDLLTNAGWKAAADYYNNVAGAWTAIGTSAPTATCTTNASGVCDFSGLDLGLYYVKEVSAPAGYTMAAPFLVTLPMTNPAGPDGDLATTDDNNTSWMYDVYVYPKNQQDSITKSVEDKGTVTTDPTTTAASDHQIDYTLETTVTDGTAPLGMYVLYDNLDPSLTFTGTKLTINSIDLVRCTAVNTPTNCDYTVYTASDWGQNATLWNGAAVTGGPVVTIVLSDHGLGVLEANRSVNLFTTLNTTVNKEDADGIVPNTSSFIPNEQWWNQNGTTTVNPETPTTTPPTTPPGIPSNEVKTKYGDLVITKLDPKATTPAADMAGAEFAVYIDPTPTTGCTADDVIGTPVKTGVIPTTTGVDNTLTIKGLQTSDFYNNTQYTAEQSDMFIKYCLVETKAPEGYNLNAEAIQFTILVPATVTNLASTALTVYNELKNLGNNLPLTGGAGVAAFSTLGLLLVGGGMAYYVVTSRRRREQDI